MPRYSTHSLEGQRANSPLARGFFGVLTGILGDMDYLAGTLQLPRWSRSVNCCPLCQCCLHGVHTWKHFKADAPWVSTCWTPSTWLDWAGKSPSPLFQIRHVTACNVCSDWMHSKYLGSDMTAYASVLWLAIFILGNSDPQSNLLDFEKHLKMHYKEHKTESRYSAFCTTRMFVNKKGLKLKGKAAQIKAFGKPLFTYWQKLYNPAVYVQKLVLIYLKLNLQCEELLDLNKSEEFFNSEDAAKFQSAAFGYSHIHHLLFDHFESEEVPKGMFQVTSKMHWQLHSALLSQYISPRLVWCFQGEDLMRKVQSLGASCTSGNSLVTSTVKMMDHWRIAAHFQWSQ